MRVTTKGRYAVRAMTNLALAALGNGAAPKSIRVICEEEHISPEFLEQIFYKLKKSGIISSTRGPAGGFVLARQAADITIKDILLAVDEGLSLTPCTSCGEDAPEDKEVCLSAENCLVVNFWKETAEHVTGWFERRTLADVVAQAAARRSLSGA